MYNLSLFQQALHIRIVAQQRKNCINMSGMLQHSHLEFLFLFSYFYIFFMFSLSHFFLHFSFNSLSLSSFILLALVFCSLSNSYCYFFPNYFKLFLFFYFIILFELLSSSTELFIQSLKANISIFPGIIQNHTSHLMTFYLPS